MKIQQRRFSDAYLRFQRQVSALKAADFSTVKKLAMEAGHELEMKRSGRMRLL